MAQSDASVYVTDSFSEPMTAQHNFVNQYDLSDPSAAMDLYARTMHKHTKHQMDMATKSARRRSHGTASSLMSESSADSVISSDS